MTDIERIKALQRRADHLRKRIEQAEARPDWRGLSYDRAELNALDWVIALTIGVLAARG